MAGKKKTPDIEKLKKRRKKLLKDAGFIQRDLRRKSTPAQQAAETRAWRKYGDLLDKSKFAARKTKNKAQEKLLRQSGYMVKAGKVYINKEGYTDIRLREKHIYLYKKGKSRKDFLLPPDKFLGELEKRLKTPLPPNQEVTVKIGDNGAFGKKRVSYEELQHYITHVFKPNLSVKENYIIKHGTPNQKKKVLDRVEARRQYLISHMSIVTIKA